MFFIRYIIWLLGFIGDITNEFLDKNIPFMSASISFYAFFSLFPLLLALIIIFSLFVGIKGFDQLLIDTVKDFIPILEEQDDAFIKTFFDSLTSKRFITSAIAAVGLLIASTAVFSSVRKSINLIWGIEKKRTFIQERAIDFTLIFFALVLLLISFILTTGLSFLNELITITFPDSPLRDPTIWRRFALMIPPLLTFFVFFICLWWLPNVKLRFIEIFPAALLGAIFEEIIKMVFILYLRNFSGISGSIYGGVSAIIVLMAFIYISAIILLIAAQVSARFTVYLSVRKLNKQNKIIKLSLNRLN